MRAGLRALLFVVALASVAAVWSLSTHRRASPIVQLPKTEVRDAAVACEETLAPSAQWDLREMRRFSGLATLGHAVDLVYASAEGTVFRLDGAQLAAIPVHGGSQTDPGGPSVFGRYPDELWAYFHGTLGKRHGFVFGPSRAGSFTMTSVVPEDERGYLHIRKLEFDKERPPALPQSCNAGVPPFLVHGAGVTLVDGRGNCDPEVLLVRGASASPVTLPSGDRVAGIAADDDWLLVAFAERSDTPSAYAMKGGAFTRAKLPDDIVEIHSLQRSSTNLWLSADVATDGGTERALFVGERRARCWSRVHLPAKLAAVETDRLSIWVLLEDDFRWTLYHRDDAQ